MAHNRDEYQFVSGVRMSSTSGPDSGFLPGGGRDIFRRWRYNITNLRPLFVDDILDTFFLFVFYLLYASFVPRNVLVQGGSKSKPLERVRGWRGGPLHPPEIAFAQIVSINVFSKVARLII